MPIFTLFPLIIMAIVATPTQAVNSLAIPAAQALAADYPATLFGFTPADAGYWREPGLPWLMPELAHNSPLDERPGVPAYYRSWATLPCIADIDSDRMAPRFPRGCAVNTMPVFNKQMLVVGKVYTYRFIDQATGEHAWTIGRLVRIGGNCLEVKPDNEEQVSLWLLRDDERTATWDVREVTHYAAYPAYAD